MISENKMYVEQSRCYSLVQHIQVTKLDSIYGSECVQFVSHNTCIYANTCLKGKSSCNICSFGLLSCQLFPHKLVCWYNFAHFKPTFLSKRIITFFLGGGALTPAKLITGNYISWQLLGSFGLHNSKCIRCHDPFYFM